MGARLDVGAGTRPTPGYLTVDLYQADADFQCPMWDIPLGDGEADEIYCSHALEHVMYAQVTPTLREWKRLLAPGGRLTLRVPDLEWCVKTWLERHELNDFWDLAKIFGSQEHEGNIHRTGFTRESLAKFLEDAGFVIDKFDYVTACDQPTMEFICRA